MLKGDRWWLLHPFKEGDGRQVHFLREITAMEWCAPMVAVPSKNKGQPRRSIDLNRLNKVFKSENYILPTTVDNYPNW